MTTVNDNSEARGGKKAYSASVQVKAHSSTSCAFCWFVLTVYPTLSAMTESDNITYRTHLRKSHGLVEEIKP